MRFKKEEIQHKLKFLSSFNSFQKEKELMDIR